MNILSNFSENLNDLLIEHNINAKYLANALYMGNSTIARYLNGSRVPTIKYLVKIADYFQCSTDYLLGLEDEMYTKTFLICPPFAQRLEYLIKYFKCSSYHVYHDGGITKSKYYKWKNGESIPNLDNVIKLAQLFGCSVDFVIGRSNG